VTLVASDFVTIEIKEEITWPFTVAYLNDYTGTQSPTIGQFTDGRFANLGLSLLQQTDSRWAMIITQRQDYENSENRKYTFSMGAETVQVTVNIEIKNFFDNRPTVNALDSTCSVNVSDSIFLFLALLIKALEKLFPGTTRGQLHFKLLICEILLVILDLIMCSRKTFLLTIDCDGCRRNDE
jgi:hypothetical protein